MTIATIRQRLISYLEDADDKKIKAIYTLLEEDINNGAFTLSDEQLQILEKERELYLSGKAKSYNRAEAMQLIRKS